MRLKLSKKKMLGLYTSKSVSRIPQGRTVLEKLPFLFLTVLWERKLARIGNTLLTELERPWRGVQGAHK